MISVFNQCDPVRRPRGEPDAPTVFKDKTYVRKNSQRTKLIKNPRVYKHLFSIYHLIEFLSEILVGGTESIGIGNRTDSIEQEEARNTHNTVGF